jgi:arylsulfatase A-like enzyme
VGALLAAIDDLGLRQNTLVIFHADHGEMLGDRLYVGHGMDLYDPVLRVPLIVRLPARVPAGVRVQTLARNVDIFPTVLDAAGIRPGRRLSGASLLPLIENAGGGGLEALPVRDTYAETYMPAIDGFRRQVKLPDGSTQSIGMVIRGVRTPAWKFVRNEPLPYFERDPAQVPALPAETLASLTTEELYDLRSDPLEHTNVIGQQPAVAAEMRSRLAQFLAGERTLAPTAALDEEARRRLRILGYGD